MKVSIRTISQITGFSPATVSNALNHKKGVNPETAETILHMARKHGYSFESKVNKIRFVTFRRNGLIIDESQFFSQVMEGVERQAKDFGYETIYSKVDLEPGYEQQVQEIVEDPYTAIILLGTEMLEEDYQLFEHHVAPLILLDGWCESISYDGVFIDNTDAACSATKYLIDHGHERIGYLKGDFRIAAFRYRERGVRQALERQKMPYDPAYEVTVGTTVTSAYEDMKKYLAEKRELPTAFFADNDVIACSAVRAMKEAKIRVPEDVSIVAFDDVPFSTMANPALTTVHVYRQEMGEIAVRRLLDNINYNNHVKTKIQVCSELVERESVRRLDRYA